MWKQSIAFALIALAVPRAYGQPHQGHNHGHSHQSEAMGHTHEKSELHGGSVMMTKAHHFEIVFLADGIRVYPYNHLQEPISALGMKGSATLHSKGEPLSLPLVYRDGGWVKEGNDSARARDYLYGAADLKSAKPGAVRVRFALEALPEEGETSVDFIEPFRGLTERPFACPMHPDAWGRTAKSECPLCGMHTGTRRIPPAPREVK